MLEPAAGLLPAAEPDQDRGRLRRDASARAAAEPHRATAAGPRRPLRAGTPRVDAEARRHGARPGCRRRPDRTRAARCRRRGARRRTPARRAARSHGAAAARDGSSMTSEREIGVHDGVARRRAATSTPRRRAVSVAATVPRIETRGGTPRALARWMARTRCPKPIAGWRRRERRPRRGDAASRARAAAPPALPRAVTSPVRAGR